MEHASVKVVVWNRKNKLLNEQTLFTSKEKQLSRIGNLIQTETLYYYQKKGAAYTFDLRNSYTYVHTEADVKVKQMLPALIDSSLFEITREQYRGY